MKFYLLFISLLMLVHFSWVDMKEYATEIDNSIENTCIKADGCIDAEKLANDNEHLAKYNPWENSFDNAESHELQIMARQLRLSSARIQRLIDSNNILFIKCMVKSIAQRTTLLTSCASRTHSTLRRTCWEVASECYVYGIRHIII